MNLDFSNFTEAPARSTAGHGMWLTLSWPFDGHCYRLPTTQCREMGQAELLMNMEDIYFFLNPSLLMWLQFMRCFNELCASVVGQVQSDAR